MRKYALAAAVAAGLTGCGSTAQNSDAPLSRGNLADRAVIPDTTGVELTQSGPNLTTDDQRVTGTSCKNKMWDPEPSEANAVNLMKLQAAARGYNAVHTLKVTKDPAAIMKNCWSSLTATGIAYKRDQSAK